MLSLSRLRGELFEKEAKRSIPCGYSFETFSSKDDAIAMVQLHVESFHKDFLPFGEKEYGRREGFHTIFEEKKGRVQIKTGRELN
jgi:RNA recognition motif-containing protein